MSDLIERQQAIDALGEEPYGDTDYDIGLRNQWKWDVEAIQKLPSAEPHSINLNQGQSSDMISRQQAIDICENAIDLWNGQLGCGALVAVKDKIEQMPSAEPQIVRCKDCRYYKQFGKSEWGDCLALSRICKSIDFCSWGARMNSEQILSEANNDTAYGGLMSAT